MQSNLATPSAAENARRECLSADQIHAVVSDVLTTTSFIDVHTHLFDPALGKIGLWGIDELLTYHYLEAELFRSSSVTPERYWSLKKQEQADIIWQALFVENTPLSEATRGIVAVLAAFGLPTTSDNLAEARAFFDGRPLRAHIDNVLAMAGLSSVVMTNDPLDPDEAPLWIKGFDRHPGFQAVLRLDRILRGWESNWERIAAQGYAVDRLASEKSLSELRRFLREWHIRMQPVYMAVSLPYTFQFPQNDLTTKILRQAVLPVCRELDLPLSLMIGVRYQVNPTIRLAGDAVGRADLSSLENLCRDYPANRFLTSVLSRENQHELCVYARKFSNLMPFGCWWFLNNPSIVEEITRERIEMLGASFIPQHSDARVLEQVLYKWRVTRGIMTKILSHSYQLVVNDGRNVTRNDIQRDVNRLFRTNFETWVSPAE